MQSIVYEILIVIVGLVFASAMKCLVDSEDKVKFLTRCSVCSSCKQELGALDLIPIFSYLFFGGKCRYCHDRIPIDVFLYEFFTFIVLIFYFIFSKDFIFINLFHVSILIFLIFMAIEDVKVFEIVDSLFYIFLLLNIILLCSEFYFFNFIEFLFLVCIFHLLYFLARGGLGYGDIKVFCVLALNLNFFEGIYLLVFTFLYAGFFAIYLLIMKKAKRGAKVALVPFITLAYLSILLMREGILW